MSSIKGSFVEGWYYCWCQACDNSNYEKFDEWPRCQLCGERMEIKLDPSKQVTGQPETGREKLTKVQQQIKKGRSQIEYRYALFDQDSDSGWTVADLNVLCNDGWIPCREIQVSGGFILCVLMRDRGSE